MLQRAALVLLATVCGGSGCALAARDHACWPFLDHQYHGHVPSELTHTLARERGTRRQVGSYRAPLGYYWRHRHTASIDVREIRTLMGDYELAACPNGIVRGGPALPPPH